AGAGGADRPVLARPAALLVQARGALAETGASRVDHLVWEEMSQTIERPHVGGPGSGLGVSWRVIVRNDDHNTFDHVAHTLARTIPGVSVPEGYAIADRIHHTGLAIVWSGHKELAELYWEQLHQAG